MTWLMIKVWLAAGEIREIEATSWTFIPEASKKCGNLPAKRKQAATDRRILSSNADQKEAQKTYIYLKVHKIENFFDSDCGICVISLLVMVKY